VVLYICHPSYAGNINSRVLVQTGPGKKWDPISKITNRAVQVVECLPSNHVALSSNSSTANRKKKGIYVSSHLASKLNKQYFIICLFPDKEDNLGSKIMDWVTNDSLHYLYVGFTLGIAAVTCIWPVYSFLIIEGTRLSP
jgi:hypothetical protein